MWYIYFDLEFNNPV